ncbi:MAG: glycerophosphodiester phosphodiesterase [Desulfobacterales bacterium]|nr:MAG: glycerophosphodiester phosphodiesterase [Desulfobacterales bacterium]
MFKKPLRVVVGVSLFLFVTYEVLCFLAEPVEDHPYFNPDHFLVIAHRGGRGLGPENTLFLFRRSVKLGADVLEIDLRSTEDGELVILHDSTVDRTTNGHGPVRDLTLAELKNLDAAYHWTPDNGGSFPLRGNEIRVPTLAEVFGAFPQIRLNIELKESRPEVATSLCNLIEEYQKSDRVMVASFKAATLKQFRSVCPDVATSAAASEALPFYWLQRIHLESVYSPPAQALQIPQYYGEKEVITPRLIETAHSRNMRIHVWTINDVNRMQRLIDLGVDGIMTDYPDRLLELLGGDR